MNIFSPVKKLFSLQLHWKIFIGMALGGTIGALFNLCGTGVLSSCPTWFHAETGIINVGTFEWMGTVFLRLLQLIVIPLIFCALVNGISHMKVNQLGKVGITALLIFKGTMLVAAALGLVWVNIMKPGIGFDVGALTDGVPHAVEHAHLESNILLQIIPENFFEALSSKHALINVIFCALIFGIAISVMGDKAKMVSKFFEELFAITLTIVQWIMAIAPFGVFGMLLSSIAKTGFDLFLGVGMYMLTVALGLASMLFIVTPLLVWIFAKVRPMEFFKGVKEAMLTSFATSSTAATIPVSLRCVTDNLGISRNIANFAIPTAATMNMNGAALYEGVVTLFLAQAYVHAGILDIDMSLSGQIFILAMVLLSTLGTPGIPHGGLITTTIVLKAVGIPLDALGLILAVDRVLDMARTMTNTTGDCASAVMLNHLVGNKRFSDEDASDLSDEEKALLEDSQKMIEKELEEH